MRLCLEVAFDMRVKLRLERVSPPHALLQIKIQPRGGLKGSTDVQQRMGTEPKTTDSEPRECLSYVGS